MKALKLFAGLFLTCIVLTQVSFAQKVAWGVLNHSSSSNYYPSIIGEDSENIYTVASVKGDRYVEAYDKNRMKVKYSKLIEQPKIGKSKVVYEGLNLVDGKFILLASYFDKNTKESTIYAYILDAETGKVTDKRVELFSFSVEKKRRKGNFYVYLSQDRTKMLLNHYAYYKKEKKYRDSYKLIDSDLNTIVERTDVFEKGERDYRTSAYLIDNDGSLYFAKRYYNGSDYIVSYDANRDYEKWEEKIDLGKLGMGADDKITDIIFSINAKNELVVSGYYSKEGNDLNGTFFMRIDNASKEVVVSKISEFDEKFKDEFLTTRQKAKGKEKEVNNVFKSIRIVDKNDGGIVLVGEQYYRYVYDNGESELYGDLVVLNISADGELLWANRIPKKQVYSYDTSLYPIVYGSWGVSLFTWPTRITEFYSYFVALNDNEVVIVFNDNPKNFTNPKTSGRSRSLKRVQKASSVIYTMNLQTGEKKGDLFLKAKDMSVFMKPSVYYQQNQGTKPYIFGQKRKKYKYGKFSF